LVYRASQRPYRALFESVWGQQAFAISWPSEVELVCDRPGPPPADDLLAVHLGPVDRGRAGTTFDQMAQSIAGYEASAEVTAFSSKYDTVLAGKAKFTPQQQTGYDLFRGKAQCNSCHRDGGPGEDPLFTDFTASNIGTPANPRLPYYAEGQPDAFGYVANPSGTSFIDGGVGSFLRKGHVLSQPSPGGFALGPAGASQSRANSGADIAQRGQAAEPGLREGLWPQRIFHEPEGDRPFLQYARRPAALPAA
jgi:cytochrome c peroxidase